MHLSAPRRLRHISLGSTKPGNAPPTNIWWKVAAVTQVQRTGSVVVRNRRKTGRASRVRSQSTREPSRLRDGPGHWDAGRDARTRILGAGIQGPNVFVLLGRVSQLPGIPGHSTGTRIPVVAPSWDDTYMLTGTTSQLTGTQLGRNWDVDVSNDIAANIYSCTI